MAVDLSAAYTLAVCTHLPEATIVYDRFHVIQLYNNVLSNVRRAIQNQSGHEVVKGIRWLLLKNEEHLNEAKNERQRLHAGLELNVPLATAYSLKQVLRQLWHQPDKEEASCFLDDWIERAQAADIDQLETFARTLQRHREGILAYYDYPITTGPLEGVNNKIKTLKRQAYGFRDLHFFKLRILGLHETKYA